MALLRVAHHDISGWQKLCEGTKSIRQKVWAWTKLSTNNIRCSVRSSLRMRPTVLAKTVQTSYVEGRWHQNWAYMSPNLFFLQTDKKSSEKRIFFTLRPVSWKQRKILMGLKGKKAGIHKGTNAFWAKSCCGAVLTLFWSSEVVWLRPNAIREQKYDV